MDLPRVAALEIMQKANSDAIQMVVDAAEKALEAERAELVRRERAVAEREATVAAREAALEREAAAAKRDTPVSRCAVDLPDGIKSPAHTFVRLQASTPQSAVRASAASKLVRSAGAERVTSPGAPNSPLGGSSLANQRAHRAEQAYSADLKGVPTTSTRSTSQLRQLFEKQAPESRVMTTPPRVSPIPTASAHPAAVIASETMPSSLETSQIEPAQVFSIASPVPIVSENAVAIAARELVSSSDQTSKVESGLHAAIVVEQAAQKAEVMEVKCTEEPSSPTLETKSAGSARSLKQLFEQKAETARQNTVSARTSSVRAARRTVAEAIPPANFQVANTRTARRTWTGSAAPPQYGRQDALSQ